MRALTLILLGWGIGMLLGLYVISHCRPDTVTTTYTSGQTRDATRACIDAGHAAHVKTVWTSNELPRRPAEYHVFCDKSGRRP